MTFFFLHNVFTLPCLGYKRKETMAFLFLQNLQNHLRRTLLRAFAAARTLAVIDDCHIIIHMDGIELALLRT